MNAPIKILVVDDNAAMRDGMAQILRKAGYVIAETGNGQDALARMRSEPVDCVITDYKMADLTGLDLLRKIKQQWPETEVMVITAYGTIELAVDIMKAGAWDFITKPFTKDTLLLKVSRICEILNSRRERDALAEENAYLRETLHHPFNEGEIIGKTPEMQAVYKQIMRMADSDSAVFVFGESGTGKELVAHAIHRHSPRKHGPFIRVNCGALAEGVLESELFGHEKGAFTGAIKCKKGRFELAHKGTLFLDEIGDIPMATQVKLLRVLQEKEFERVGGEATLHVDVRIITATNRCLPDEVRAGRFREDLYYRLHILPIDLPPLRQRKEDIPSLALHFLNKLAEGRKQAPRQLSADAKQLLLDYPWPGNVRELENVMERALVLTDGDCITATNLGFLQAGHFGTQIAETSWNLDERLASTERDLLEKAMQRCQYVKAKAARLLGIKEGALYYKLQKYGL